MCGRFKLTTPAEALAEAFGLEETPVLARRYNIAPSQDIAVIGRRDAGHGPRLAHLSWGFRRPGPDGGLLINARGETVHRLPFFRAAFQQRRCLVPADGFYEWKRGAAAKLPFLITRADGAPFALAALWQREAGPPARTTCVILTCEPNALVAQVHTRMPVILAREAHAAWLDPGLTSADVLRPLLVPCPAGELRLTALGPWVNNARHDDLRCLEPA